MPKLMKKLCNHYGIVAENSVKYVPLDGFFGIQTLQKFGFGRSTAPYPDVGAYNAPAPRFLSRLKKRITPPYSPTPLATTSVSRCPKASWPRGVEARCFRHRETDTGGAPKPNFWIRLWC